MESQGAFNTFMTRSSQLKFSIYCEHETKLLVEIALQLSCLFDFDLTVPRAFEHRAVPSQLCNFHVCLILTLLYQGPQTKTFVR